MVFATIDSYSPRGNKIGYLCLDSIMDREDEIRARAEEARCEADKTPSGFERERWLAIMRGWLALLPKRPQSDDDDRSN
jgi:hypothetical protein